MMKDTEMKGNEFPSAYSALKFIIKHCICYSYSQIELATHFQRIYTQFM
jgi:hypothetical protein